MKKIFVALFLLVVIACQVQAQSSRIHIGGVFPTGDFNDDDNYNSKSGNAAIGFNVGYKYYSPLKVPNLSLTFGIDLFYNDIKGDVKDDVEDDNPNYDVTFPKYLNIPLHVGINYVYPLPNSNIAIYGEFGLGPNLSIETLQKFESKKSDYEQKITYTPSIKLSYNLEAGIEIKQKYIFGLRYNQLGTHKYKYTITEKPDGDKEKGKMNKQPITNITLIAGIKF